MVAQSAVWAGWFVLPCGAGGRRVAAVRWRSAAPIYPLVGTLRKKGSLAESDRMVVEAIAQAGTIIRAHRIHARATQINGP